LWSKCGTILSVFFADGVVQMWTTKNYHWYLKTELTISCKDIIDATWGEGLKLRIVADSNEYKYCFQSIYSSALSESPKHSLIGSIDGTSLLLTPFAVSNVPPPMCHFKINLEQVPRYFLIHEDSDDIFLKIFFENKVEYAQIDSTNWTWKSIEEPSFEFDSSLVDLLTGSSNNLYKMANGIEFILDADQNLNTNGDLICKDCTSFITTTEFIIFTTREQKLYFWPLDELKNSKRFEELKTKSTEDTIRFIEKGAEIITSNSAECSLILQMPRGNLEIIYPRPFIFNRIRELLGILDYRNAYRTMRRHRIDLNVLVDLNPTVFISTLKNFVQQVSEPSYLNLFISGLNEENIAHQKYSFAKHNYIFCDGKVNTICNALIPLLDQTRHYEPLMTCYACMLPANLRSILSIIVSLKENTAVIEKAIKYALFLIEPEKLYNEALAMYNLPLALSLAKRASTMNPQDYQPFLNKLSRLPLLEQQFQICEYLKDFREAIRVLLKMCNECEDPRGEDRVIAFILDRKLFKEGIETCSGKIRNHILAEYAKTLNPTSAIKALLLAGYVEEAKKLSSGDDWLLLFKNLREEELRPLRNQSIEIATRIGDIEAAVNIALKEEKYTWALRHTTLDITAELEQASTSMLLCISECLGELKSKFERLFPLQSKFISDPVSFILAAVAVTTLTGDSETASQMSFVSRQSALSSASKRSKKKQERNKLKDKPGSPFEREFLHHSIVTALTSLKKISEGVTDLKEALELNDSLAFAKQLSLEWKKVLFTIRGFKDKYESLAQYQFTKQTEDVLEVRALLEDYIKMKIDFPEFTELSSDFY
jgi:hypothetical protein